MSTVQEIETAIPQLSHSELVQFRDWFEEYMEDHLELTDEVKAKLDESRREIAAGQFSSREALRQLQQDARLTPVQAEDYLREVHAERLAAEA